MAALEEIAVQLVAPLPDEHIRTLFEPSIRAALTDVIQRWLTHRAFPLALSIVAMTLTLPALATGWHFDDYLHLAALTASESPSIDVALNKLFVFMDGDPARTQRLIERGEFPWWALPEGKNAFWRPLAGLTHWLDYRLWPNSPLLMHAHSLLWFGALVLAVTHLYRRLIGASSIAGVAALMYALDDARGYAVSWIANRNALLATLCCCLALIAHDRWRRDGWRWGGVVVPLLVLLGLLSAEAAVAVLGYLAAYTLVLDRGGVWQRLWAFVPALVTTIVWRLIYEGLGYGAAGTSYIDPSSDPLRFVLAVVERAPVLLLGQWALPPAELYPFLTPPITWLLWLAAVLVLALIGRLFWPLLRRDVLARFWAVGMLLATIPACAALPANRLLSFIGIGAAGVLVRWLVEMWQMRGCWKQALVTVLSVTHLVLAPLLLPVTAYSPALIGSLEPVSDSVPHHPGVSDQTIIFVTAPSFFSISYLPIMRVIQKSPAPERIRFLASTLVDVDLVRPDEYTLVARPANGYLTGFDTVFRDPSVSFEPGQHIMLSDVTITIMQLTSDGRPAEVAFRFNVPLEAERLLWLVWHNDRFVSFVPPRVGETIHLPNGY